MASNTATEVYDLLILVDATYSMTNYIASLKTSLPKVIALSNLTDSFARIGLLAYRDYSEASRRKNGLLEWSGWYDPENPNAAGNINASSLMAAASELEAVGGGDYPEAIKTGLARANELMREEATTIILLYTDAPPHCGMVALTKREGGNYDAEQVALNDAQSYGGYGPFFADWVSACNHLRCGPKKAHVFCFLDGSLGIGTVNSGYYTYLSTITHGASLTLAHASPQDIAQTTVHVLLAWMGVTKVGADKEMMPAILVRYREGDNLKQIKDEKDSTANSYFWAAKDTNIKASLATNVAQVDLDSHVLEKYLPRRKTAVTEFAQRYVEDAQYRKTVGEQLKVIIESDVSSMSLNPVFGSLWRAVCHDRANPMRDEMITNFSFHVDKLKNEDEKARMKGWLEQSYDYATEISDTLGNVSGNQSFPCVILDPTISFRQANNKSEDGEDDDEINRPITALRRDELLEIGRSCDGRVLRRLGRILTQLTYVQSADDLPAHLATTTNAEVPRIPLVLASKKHEWKFFKILLHVVVPGTKLSARSAAILAALVIRIGLKPLFEAACATMLFWREKWNNLDVPETWNASCLGLLLDADEEYRKQMATDGKETLENGLLFRHDRDLFSRLVTYQYAGSNLLTTLTARIGWTPDKTMMPVGPIMICRSCKFPRSVTIMVARSGGKCGLCVAEDWADTNHKRRAINSNVSQEDTRASNATWTECSVHTCRAQYVCYNPNDLNVRPKCHYCRDQAKASLEKRNDKRAPTLECKRCLSKVIWPYEYRGSVTGPFICVACGHDRTTIIDVQTNPAQLSQENGEGWLLRNDRSLIKEPFKRSLFHTITQVGIEPFMASVEILPNIQPEPTLRLKGKCVRNQPDLKAELWSWISRRTAEKSCCSLCFHDFAKTQLFPACRRHGCRQQVCGQCLNGWYGLNRPGTIINMAAIFCPFCRRIPAARTLAAYGKGIHAVSDLAKAVVDNGQWIYAWCYDCGKSKRYMERECARGAPHQVEHWRCDCCVEADLERARIAEEEALQALEAATLLAAQERQAAYERLQNAAQLRKELEFPVKECPGCHTPTQKSMGCDHMTCVVPRCGTHWCWTCGEAFVDDEIYDHMMDTHHSIYAGGLGLDG